MNGPLSSVEEDQQEHHGSEDISEVEVDVPRLEAARLERGLHEQAVDRQVEAALEKVGEGRPVLPPTQEPSRAAVRAGGGSPGRRAGSGRRTTTRCTASAGWRTGSRTPTCYPRVGRSAAAGTSGAVKGPRSRTPPPPTPGTGGRPPAGP